MIKSTKVCILIIHIIVLIKHYLISLVLLLKFNLKYNKYTCVDFRLRYEEKKSFF